MKKLIALLLALVMVVGLVACGTDAPDAPANNDNPSANEPGNNKEPGNNEEPQEIVEIVCQICTLTEPGEGFYRMEAALNEMLEKDIGVHVTFERTDILNCTTDAALAIQSEEQLDVIISFGTGTIVWENGMCIPLDDYVQYAPDIVEQSGAYLDMCKIDGQLAGFTVMGVNADGYGYMMKKSVADKYGFTRDVNKLYTLDDLTAMFEIIDAGEEDTMLMQVSTSAGSMGLNSVFAFDSLGVSYNVYGGLIFNNDNYDPTKFVNLYATPEYADYCQTMYEWAQKGWISADAAVTTDSADEILARDDAVGFLAYGSFDDRLQQVVAWSDEVVVFNTQPSVNSGSMAGMMWHVTPTCENPEKAVEFLNYFYKNPEAFMLVQFGFEGEEWEVVAEEGDNKQVRWMSANPLELSYYIAYPWIGNQLELPVFEPNPIEMNDIKLAIAEKNPTSPAMGYVFDSSAYANEIAAITAVMEKYIPMLNAGAVNPAKVLPEFLAELEAAGINEVIAANQEQFDQFLANK